MKTGALILFCGIALLRGAEVTVQRPGDSFTRSRSGQFLVYGNPAPRPLLRPLSMTVVTNWVRLQPTLLAVSCERIKEALLLELAAQDDWQGKFYLRLRPIRSPADLIEVTSARMGHEWHYNVAMPDAVGANRLARTMVKLLLVEWVGRTSGAMSPTVPDWLSEGLAEQVLANTTIDLVLRPPESPRPNAPPVRTVQRLERRAGSLAHAHEYLRVHPPVSLDELFAPAPPTTAEVALQTYRSSAQLFVHRLGQLPGGKASLRAMLNAPGLATDPEAALLAAFHSHFANRMDLEKWWELQSAQFTGRELSQRWFGLAGLEKLDELLPVALQVRADTNAPVEREVVSLQTAVGEFRQSWQTASLKFKTQQLQALQLRTSREVAALVEDYRRTIEAYLRRAQRARVGPDGKRLATVELNSLARNTNRRLDQLDARRAALRERLAAEQKTGVAIRR